ncbi:MAG: hypothetical protein KBS53_01980, partial [Bacteroidales bacterium]|nr:hypothetical protein [Candidatus Hennigimonas equi]
MYFIRSWNTEQCEMRQGSLVLMPGIFRLAACDFPADVSLVLGSQPGIFRNLPGPSLVVTAPGFPKIFQAVSLAHRRGLCG